MKQNDASNHKIINFTITVHLIYFLLVIGITLEWCPRTSLQIQKKKKQNINLQNSSSTKRGKELTMKLLTILCKSKHFTAFPQETYMISSFPDSSSYHHHSIFNFIFHQR
jgi:hypothetical protein